MPKKINEAVKKYAEQLYYTVDTGNNPKNNYHKYSLQDIAYLIEKDFDIEIHRDTIQKWVKKGCWHILYKSVVLNYLNAGLIKDRPDIASINLNKKSIDCYLASVKKRKRQSRMNINS